MKKAQKSEFETMYLSFFFVNEVFLHENWESDRKNEIPRRKYVKNWYRERNIKVCV